MTTWVLLAPGPSASAEQAEEVQASRIPIGVVGCAYQLIAKPDFIAATDSAWWRKYPDAKDRGCGLYTMHKVPGVEQIRMPKMAIVNSGVLALECAKRLGATRILLLGFDMRGSHFFGPYVNGLRNTTERKRADHLRQYARWGNANPQIEVINCTQGSALACFAMARIDDEVARARCMPAAAQGAADALHRSSEAIRGGIGANV